MRPWWTTDARAEESRRAPGGADSGRSRARRWAPASLVVALLAACASAPGPDPSLPKGRVSLRYRGYDGTLRSLAALRGRPVIVAMVATWAGPALVEVERLRVIEAAYDGRVEVLILVLDEDPQMAAIFAETFRLPEAVGRVDDPKQLIGPKGPFGPVGVVPTSVLLDAEGRIVVRSDGPWPAGVLERALEALLKSTGS